MMAAKMRVRMSRLVSNKRLVCRPFCALKPLHVHHDNMSLQNPTKAADKVQYDSGMLLQKLNQAEWSEVKPFVPEILDITILQNKDHVLKENLLNLTLSMQ